MDQNELLERFGAGKQLVTLDILYHRPDHRWLLQHFLWQTLDNVPELPRVTQFLEFWRREIQAAIQSIEVAVQHPSGRPVILTPAFDTTIH